MNLGLPQFRLNTAALRNRFGRVASIKTQTVRPMAPIQHFLMVGAAIYSGILGDRDEEYLSVFIAMLDAAKIPVSKNVKVTVLNLNDGHDFLDMDRPIKADACSFNYLYYSPQSHFSAIGEATKQSYLAGQTDLWHKSLVKTGARVVFNVHSNDLGGPSVHDSELPTCLLNHAPYKQVAQFNKSQSRSYDMLVKN